jgi:hypothetical protein
MIVSPQGQGARSTLDRAGHALLFMALGPIILCLNFLVDLGWFIRHLYKMDLEKSNTGRSKMDSIDTSSTSRVEINRRTYRKMVEYFSQRNEQMVQ